MEGETIYRLRELSELLPGSYSQKLNQLADTYTILEKPSEATDNDKRDLRQLIAASYRALDQRLLSLKPKTDPRDLTGKAQIDAALLTRKFMLATLSNDTDGQREAFDQYEKLTPGDLIGQDDVKISDQVMDTIRSTLEKPEPSLNFAKTGNVTQLSKGVESRVQFLMNARCFYDGNTSSSKYMPLTELIDNLTVIIQEFQLSDHLAYLILKRHTAGTSYGMVCASESEGSTLAETINSLKNTYGISLSSADAFAKLQAIINQPLYRSIARNLAYINTMSRQSAHLNIICSNDPAVESKVSLVLNLQWAYLFLLKYFPESHVKDVFSSYTATLKATESGTASFSRLVSMITNRFGSSMPATIIVREESGSLRNSNQHEIAELQENGQNARSGPMMSPLGLPIQHAMNQQRVGYDQRPKPRWASSQGGVSRMSRNKQARTCNLCNRPGHFWRNCLAYRGLEPTQNVCNTCGGRHPGNCKHGNQLQITDVSDGRPRVDMVNEITHVHKGPFKGVSAEFRVITTTIITLIVVAMTLGIYALPVIIIMSMGYPNIREYAVNAAFSIYMMIETTMCQGSDATKEVVSSMLERMLGITMYYIGDNMPYTDDVDEVNATLHNGRPCVHISVLGEPLEVLVDTGASQNIMQQSTFTRLNKVIGPIDTMRTDVHLVAHNLTTIKTLFAVRLPISVPDGDRQYHLQTEFIVVKNDHGRGSDILGAPFLQDSQCRIKYTGSKTVLEFSDDEPKPTVNECETRTPLLSTDDSTFDVMPIEEGIVPPHQPVLLQVEVHDAHHGKVREYINRGIINYSIDDILFGDLQELTLDAKLRGTIVVQSAESFRIDKSIPVATASLIPYQKKEIHRSEIENYINEVNGYKAENLKFKTLDTCHCKPLGDPLYGVMTAIWVYDLKTSVVSYDATSPFDLPKDVDYHFENQQVYVNLGVIDPKHFDFQRFISEISKRCKSRVLVAMYDKVATTHKPLLRKVVPFTNGVENMGFRVEHGMVKPCHNHKFKIPDGIINDTHYHANLALVKVNDFMPMTSRNKMKKEFFWSQHDYEEFDGIRLILSRGLFNKNKCKVITIHIVLPGIKEDYHRHAAFHTHAVIGTIKRISHYLKVTSFSLFHGRSVCMPSLYKMNYYQGLCRFAQHIAFDKWLSQDKGNAKCSRCKTRQPQCIADLTFHDPYYNCVLTEIRPRDDPPKVNTENVEEVKGNGVFAKLMEQVESIIDNTVTASNDDKSSTTDHMSECSDETSKNYDYLLQNYEPGQHDVLAKMDNEGLARPAPSSDQISEGITKLCENIPKEHKQTFIDVFKRNEKIFATDKNWIGAVETDFSIEWKSNFHLPRRIIPVHGIKSVALNTMIYHLERNGMIVPSLASAASPAFVALRNSSEFDKNQKDEEFIDQLRKENNIRPNVPLSEFPIHDLKFFRAIQRRYRFLIDYKALNSNIFIPLCVLPRFEDFLSGLSTNSCVCVLDIKSCFPSLKMKKQSDLNRLSFVVNIKNSYSVFAPQRLPEGLNCSPSLLCHTLRGILNSNKYLQEHKDVINVFIDDILILAKSPNQLARHLDHLLDTLREAGFLLSLNKCKVLPDKFTYLGFDFSKIEQDGHHKFKYLPETSLLSVIECLKSHLPKNKKQLLSAIGKVLFCKSFVPYFSHKSHPLNEMMTEQKRDLKWNPERVKSYHDLMDTVGKKLALFAVDPNVSNIQMEVDSSSVGVGAYAYYVEDGEIYPVTFYSKSFSVSLRQASAPVIKEGCGVLMAAKGLPHLITVNTTIHCDCRSLILIARSSKHSENPYLQRIASNLSVLCCQFAHTGRDKMHISDSIAKFMPQPNIDDKMKKKEKIRVPNYKHLQTDMIQAPLLHEVKRPIAFDELRKIAYHDTTKVNYDMKKEHSKLTSKVEEIGEVGEFVSNLVKRIQNNKKMRREEVQNKILEYLRPSVLVQYQDNDEYCQNIIRNINKYPKHRLFLGRCLVKLTPNGPNKHVYVVPDELKYYIISCMHVLFTHAGKRQTRRQIKRIYSIRRLKETTDSVINACKNCLKTSVQNRFMGISGMLKPAESPSTQFYIDVAHMPSVMTAHGIKKEVLVMVDGFSFFIMAESYHHVRNEHVIAFLERCINLGLIHTGVAIITSDRATNLIDNSRVKQCLISYNIRGRLCSLASSKTNLCEAAIHKLKLSMHKLNFMLQTLDGANWAETLPKACYIVNRVVRTRYGKEMCHPAAQLNYPHTVNQLETPFFPNANESDQDRINSITNFIKEESDRRTELFNDRQKELDRKLRNIPLRIGMYVALKDHTRRFKGPYYRKNLYKVIKIEGLHVHLLSLGPEQRIVTAHLTHIKPIQGINKTKLNHAPSFVRDQFELNSYDTGSQNVTSSYRQRRVLSNGIRLSNPTYPGDIGPNEGEEEESEAHDSMPELESSTDDDTHEEESNHPSNTNDDTGSGDSPGTDNDDNDRQQIRRSPRLMNRPMRNLTPGMQPTPSPNQDPAPSASPTITSPTSQHRGNESEATDGRYSLRQRLQPFDFRVFNRTGKKVPK